MDSDVRSSKFTQETIASESICSIQKNGRFMNEDIHNCIDTHMLEWLKTLNLPEQTAGDYAVAINGYLEQIGRSLRQARQGLNSQNRESLEEIALELSHNALKLGAINILRASFALQNLARCGAFRDAQDVVEQIEVEYLKVQQGFENVV